MIEIRVPQLGEGLREVRIVQLLREQGDIVSRGDTLYVIETDKTTVEMESPSAGRLLAWCVAPNDVVPIGEIVATLGTENTETGAQLQSPRGVHLVPPRTRTYARAIGLSEADLNAIPAATDKLTPSDIDAFMSQKAGVPAASGPRTEQRVVGANRTLIFRLRRSASTVIPGTIAIEVPWSRLIPIQATGNGLRATPFQVFGYSLAKIAQDHPRFRSIMASDDIVREYDEVNIGLALARPKDELITAVIRGAHRMTFPEFVRACRQQMRVALLYGDTATEDTQILLTSLAKYGVVDAVPTLVAPASATLFLGAKSEHGAARIVMTFDHRLINGAAAGKFLRAIRDSVGRT